MMRSGSIPVFYVVTRAGRRTSPSDYWTWGEAKNAASRMRSVLKQWKDPDFSRIEIIKTTTPESIT